MPQVRMRANYGPAFDVAPVVSRRALAWALVVAMVLWCVPGAAQTRSQQSLSDAIQLQRGASCLEKARLVAHVKMWLNESRVSSELRVHVIGDTSNPLAIVFDIERGARVRRRAFQSAPKSCDDVHAVVGLAIALAIDAERMHLHWLEERPAFVPRWLGAVAFGASQGLPLDLAVGMQVGMEVSWSTWLSTRADLLTQFAWGNAISGTAGHFDTLLLAASLQLCAGGRPDPRLRLAVCTGAAAGALHAWGTGYAPNDSNTGVWLAARNGVRFEAQLGVTWVLDIDLVSALSSPSFSAGASRGGEQVRPASSSAFMLSLGPALVF